MAAATPDTVAVHERLSGPKVGTQALAVHALTLLRTMPAATRACRHRHRARERPVKHRNDAIDVAHHLESGEPQHRIPAAPTLRRAAAEMTARIADPVCRAFVSQELRAFVSQELELVFAKA